MNKYVCYNCGDLEVTAYAGKYEFPLCTKCWMALRDKKLLLKDLEEKYERGKDE